MLFHLDEAAKILQAYANTPAIALYSHILWDGYYRPGTEELIALFDTLEQAQAFVKICRSDEPQVKEGYLRCFKQGTLLYSYVGWSNAPYYRIALPWLDYTGIPRNP